jgi:polyphosphate kinase
VRSVIDRYLEHSRIYYFENACQPEVYIGSADWMTRNLERRIEVIFPILDGAIRDRIVNEILAVTLNDNVKTRFLQRNNKYVSAKRARGTKRRRSQVEFMKLAGDRKKSSSRPRESSIRLELKPNPFLKKRTG